MSRKQKDFDPKRNHIFAAAIDELRRREGKKLSQKEIADRMGVTEDTVSRIMRLHNQVTEDIITRLQTACGCIFNLQWLRGESDVMLVADVDNKPTPVADNLHESTHIDQSSLMNATIAAQQTSIESLKRELAKTEESAKRELAAKDETISALRGQLATKDAQLNDKDAYIEILKQQVADLRSTLALQQTKDNFGNYPFTPGVADEGRKAQV
jgi:transcriptional regulator with XRE-family HTH domain